MDPVRVRIRRTITITQLALTTLICGSFQDGHEQTQGVLQCGPENVSLSTSGETLLLTWNDGASCSSLGDAFIYELEVLIADRTVHHDQVSVAADRAERPCSWNWTSHLSLDCAPHSVRLRSRYDNQTSPWKQEQKVPGTRALKKRVFPRDRVFQAGSKATFCCVVPAGQSFDHMYLSGYEGAEMNTSEISDQTYGLTLLLEQPSELCVDVKCQTNTTSYGACTYIGYPPDDRDLQCETRDLESVDCSWTVGRHTHLSLKSPTRYQLLGRLCESASKGRCSQMMQIGAEERNWTLKAENKLGTVELHDRADLTKRVHMFAPDALTASAVNSRNASLTWTWTVEQYKDLNITCQTLINHAETVESVGMGLKVVVLKELIPHWRYSVRVRCGTAQHFWRWGDWSRDLVFHTRGDVPEALNVWMQMKENHTLVMWKKLLANQSHGEILDYEVTWTKSREEEWQIRSKVANSNESVTLSLNPGEEHMVTVRARNTHGSSSPSTIIIPSRGPGRPAVSTSRISGAGGGFSLSWPTEPAASCGYTVDWCPASGAGSVDWLTLPPSETSVSVVSENLRDGVRYFLSVYACTDGAPVLLQRHEGYVRETRIKDNLFRSLKLREQGSDVEVSWEPIALGEQTAFIHGYALHCQDHSSSPLTVSTSDPHATSLTVRNLRKSWYTFTVTAVTAVGECGNTSITATLSSQTDNLIWLVFMTLGIVFALLSFTTVICYRQWACIKEKVYPPIPKPVLTETFLSPTEYLVADQRLHTEADILDILDVPELLYNPGELLNGYLSQEDEQTLNGFNNSSELQDTAEPPAGPSTVPPRDFFNPTYNVAPETEAESGSSPEVQAETGSPDGYKPQSLAEKAWSAQSEQLPDSRMSLVSAYISLPSSQWIHTHT
ncbi:leukemia inhibitory factor receptor-like [Salarias fasciatus]|uniref:Leukemia inhibitory factor receptor-like n=1 Tax=Salarias fasciatus TaxID=181472 RepID=A0A672F7R0_SALFA|nr:leukemia inhibitory factor receptor-like [Salarias fasciatus]